jgi:hypothetical protein
VFTRRTNFLLSTLGSSACHSRAVLDAVSASQKPRTAIAHDRLTLAQLIAEGLEQGFIGLIGAGLVRGAGEVAQDHVGVLQPALKAGMVWERVAAHQADALAVLARRLQISRADLWFAISTSTTAIRLF